VRLRTILNLFYVFPHVTGCKLRGRCRWTPNRRSQVLNIAGSGLDFGNFIWRARDELDCVKSV